MDDAILARSLEELDGDRWGEPDDDATSLVRECHRLRTVPVGTLTDDDLRLLLRQTIGVNWLVPIALNRLGEEPLAGESYPGDLMTAVLGVGTSYWADHPAETLSLWHVREALEQLRTDADQLLKSDNWPKFG
jgi:CDI immunity proteins